MSKKNKPDNYKPPVYDILGEKYQLRPLEDYSMAEVKIIDSFLVVSNIQNNQMNISTAPENLFPLVLRKTNDPGNKPEINIDGMKLGDMMDLIARLAVDLLLEKQHFLAGSQNMTKSSILRYAKQTGLM